MEDIKQELVEKMIVKLNESRSYFRIKTVIFLLWLFEFVAALLGYVKYDGLFIVIILVLFFGNYQLTKKYNATMEEYHELKNEYINRFEDENI